MASIKGINVHRNRLRRMKSKYMQDAVIKAMYDAGELVRQEAQNSIREGGISGSGHVPSLPGQPPNADTHNLDMSIDVRVSKTRKSVEVISRADYSAALEFGTSEIVERPFMRPALQKHRNRAVRGAAEAVSKTIRVYKDSTASIDGARDFISGDDIEPIRKAG